MAAASEKKSAVLWNQLTLAKSSGTTEPESEEDCRGKEGPYSAFLQLYGPEQGELLPGSAATIPLLAQCPEPGAGGIPHQFGSGGEQPDSQGAVPSRLAAGMR